MVRRLEAWVVGSENKAPDYGAVLNRIMDDIRPYLGQGRPADYIPALAQVDPMKFGMAVQTADGAAHVVGDGAERFSIQSISKVFSLTLAMRFEGPAIWQRVGREPSGNPFNSLVQLEYEQGIPRNPFINAGALVMTDIIMRHTDDAKGLMLAFVRELAGNDAIDYDPVVAASEWEAGHRNFALAHFLKSFGNIRGNVDQVLDTYFHQCSLTMSCSDLARAMLFLAAGGVMPGSGTTVTSPRQTKRLNALMMTCGLYDEGGDFAFRVGMPGKSGVGGGIVGVLPGELTAVVWSPALNPNHNSLCGMLALEWFTTLTGRSIF